MALPGNGIKWPPAELAPIAAKQAEFDAWYSGDPAKLNSVYSTKQDRAPYDRTSQYRGGVTGAVARMWWGKPTGNLFDNNREADKLHILPPGAGQRQIVANNPAWAAVAVRLIRNL